MDPERNPGLLGLPIELRLQIYEVLWIPLTNTKTSSVPAHCISDTASQALALLLVCRQIYAEALHTAYTRHTFTLTRNFDTHPLHDLPRAHPCNLVTTLLVPYLPSPTHLLPTCACEPPTNIITEAPIPRPHRIYTFKQLCSLVRRFPLLRTLILVADIFHLGVVQRNITSRRAHVEYRTRKARRVGDGRFVASYGLDLMDGGEGEGGRVWKLNVVGTEGTKSAELWLCALEEVEGCMRLEEEGKGPVRLAGAVLRDGRSVLV